MKWQRGHRSKNVIDRRGRGGAGLKLGLGGIIVVVVAVLFGRSDLLQLLGDTGQEQGEPVDPASDPQAELVDFMHFVFDDIQAVWHRTMPGYRDAKLVLYNRGTQTGCGYGSAAIGPFYCPADDHVYLDLSFFADLKRRFGAPGDFAQAYVIAHEIGHHVQNQTGAMARVPRDDNEMSIRLELQADCYAGVWAHATGQRALLERGDLEEALRAAAAIGDDAIQKSQTGSVSPETWTHGSSAQRTRWFRRGFERGTAEACDTFSVAAP